MKKMAMNINWYIPIVALIMIIVTTEATSDNSWRVRKMKSVAPETKSTIGKYPIYTNGVDNDAGTDTHHHYNYDTPDDPSQVRPTKGVVRETKSTIEKQSMNTNGFNNDAGTDTHHHYNFGNRPESRDRAWLMRTKKNVALDTKSSTEKHQMNTNGFNNDAGTDTHHHYFATPDDPSQVRQAKGVVPETKSTIEKQSMTTNGFNNDAGTDTHHHYDFTNRPASKDRAWLMRTKKNVALDTKSSTEKHQTNTNSFNNDAGTDTHHHYDFGNRPESADRAWLMRTKKNVALDTKSTIEKQPMNTNGFNNDAGTDTRHHYFATPDDPSQVRQAKGVVPETKSTIEKQSMTTNGFNNDAGTDTHHHYDFTNRPASKDLAWLMRTKKNVALDTKSTTEKHQMNTNDFNNDQGTDNHHHFIVPNRPGLDNLAWLTNSRKNVVSETKSNVQKHPVNTNGFNNDAATDSHHGEFKFAKRPEPH